MALDNSHQEERSGDMRGTLAYLSLTAIFLLSGFFLKYPAITGTGLLMVAGVFLHNRTKALENSYRELAIICTLGVIACILGAFSEFIHHIKMFYPN